MRTDLKGKTALITGAGSGIGKAIASKLAANGADVVINDIDAARAEATSQAIAALGQQSLAVAADIADFDQVEQMVQAALDRFEKIDILVNNAGWDTIKPFLKKTVEEYVKIIDINFKGPIFVTRAVAQHMCGRKSGKIINIASDTGRVGSLGEAVYSGCKGGLIAISKTWAREFARDNVRVNVISPGLTDTPLLDALKQEEFGKKIVEAITRQIPFGLGTPEQIADAALFFASSASDYITGQVLSVSGGLTFHD